MRIAHIQLASYGDCLNSTLMFEPIKKHFETPVLLALHRRCAIEVHTTAPYESAFYNNPYVNRIISHNYQGRPATTKEECFALYSVVPDLVRKQGYDQVFLPAPILLPTKRNSLKHPELGNNIICAFMRYLEDCNIEYDWPVKTILRLTKDEINKVNNWILTKKIMLDNHQNVLIEIHGESGQTFWNHHWTLAVVRYLARKQYTNIFISNKTKTAEVSQLEKETNYKAKWVGELTLRECAELYNRCSAFISVSSGLSNICNTDYCRKDLKWFEVVNSNTVTSAPLRIDDKIFWYKNDINAFTQILEQNGL
jgi:ADP-heptose:LPS heptosyltransferase